MGVQVTGCEQLPVTWQQVKWIDLKDIPLLYKRLIGFGLVTQLQQSVVSSKWRESFVFQDLACPKSARETWKWAELGNVFVGGGMSYGAIELNSKVEVNLWRTGTANIFQPWNSLERIRPMPLKFFFSFDTFPALVSQSSTYFCCGIACPLQYFVCKLRASCLQWQGRALL